MGFLDLFKNEKNLKLSNSKEIIELDNFNKDDIVINNKKFHIPYDVLKLLWFVDGPLKNYNPAQGKTFEVEGIIISFSSPKTVEPSAISIKLPIREVKNKNNVEKLGYYPSYGPNFLSTGLTPSQRWVYLDWLQNIEQEIDIGYVFLFYYGLERHLFLGDADSAFEMILRLRKFHKNKSFTYYTTNALIAASIFHKREDWFLKFFNTITDIEDVEVNDMYLLAKYVLKKGLTAKEIMKISKMVGFNNQRYIKDEKDLFEQELRKILIDTYSCEEMPLDRFKITDSPREQKVILANYSLDDNQRMPEIPSLTQNNIFAETVKMLLEAAHENVKTILKYLRKNKETNFIVQKIDNTPQKKPDDVYKKSPIFNEIDVKMFDENVRYYDEGICPNCKSKVDKRPAKK
ncbi:TerB N-terminal domain-containing protein [Thermobrachium celere]|uniref:TerB N-terminal domain-containing protein n=1 Tax=Thermobrachium celere DSM 8682 TaxID=941824 RepID=R7RUI9_9CLOT|nr:TerB N-terminal domain-containing protein [Thermobrachium celere]CDF59186.1 hypothetical protein TCEL_02254 [Thermobrachium celere DSM 8682]